MIIPDYFKPQKIAVLLSGGVDSSVVLALLQQLRSLGHEVTAFYLKIWLQDDLVGLGDCPWEEDLEYAMKVCDRFKVPLKVLPLQEQYWEQVVNHSINEIRLGHTPNPDMYCNSRIKFGVFAELIDPDYTAIASGHYAALKKLYISSSDDSIRVVPSLGIGRDSFKDQSYFLAYLKKEQLNRCVFPLGGLQGVGELGREQFFKTSAVTEDTKVADQSLPYRQTVKENIRELFQLPAEIDFDTVWESGFTKPEVRQLAKYFDLPNQNRKDSQGICFLGKIDFSDFIHYHMGKQVGNIIEWETGNCLGEHEGYWYYTIGQRQGLGLSGGPWYVVKKDCEKNIIYISKRDSSSFDEREFFTLKVSDINWFFKPKENFDCEVKVRHGERLIPARVEFMNDNKSSEQVQVCLAQPDFGTATGQFAVFYDQRICLGSGIIHIT